MLTVTWTEVAGAGGFGAPFSPLTVTVTLTGCL